jgi:hypothetical protein
MLATLYQFNYARPYVRTQMEIPGTKFLLDFFQINN